MSIAVIEHTGHLAGETEVSFTDEEAAEDGSEEVLRIHPWHRTYGNGDKDSSVFVSLGWFNPDGTEPDDLENPHWNIILNREDFVEGILAVFPELKRAHE